MFHNNNLRGARAVNNSDSNVLINLNSEKSEGFWSGVIVIFVIWLSYFFYIHIQLERMLDEHGVCFRFQQRMYEPLVYHREYANRLAVRAAALGLIAWLATFFLAYNIVDSKENLNRKVANQTAFFGSFLVAILPLMVVEIKAAEMRMRVNRPVTCLDRLTLCCASAIASRPRFGLTAFRSRRNANAATNNAAEPEVHVVASAPQQGTNVLAIG
jgi:hypothetical protein